MRPSMSMEEGRREFSESFPCIFPLKQGISAETGSQQTASTAIQSGLQRKSPSETINIINIQLVTACHIANKRANL
jgi:hypothetical protein